MRRVWSSVSALKKSCAEISSRQGSKSLRTSPASVSADILEVDDDHVRLSQSIRKAVPEQRRGPKLVRYAGHLGVELENFSLRNISSTDLEFLKECLSEHLVVFVRGQQDLHPQDLDDFGSQFGTLHPHPVAKSMLGHPNVLEIVKDVGEHARFGESWHSDNSFMECPTSFTILKGVEIPSFGNNTIWCNTRVAYDYLSDGMKTILDPLYAVHCAARAFSIDDDLRAARFQAGQEESSQAKGMAYNHDPEVMRRKVLHPVARTHAPTGAKALYVNPMFTYSISGLTEEESSPLLQYLYQHQTQPQFSCTFRWSPGAVAMWDNRALLHLAIDDNWSERRVMHRVTVTGERPY